MRKTILSLILLASLCGCGGSGGSDTTTAGLDGRLSEGNFILVTTDVERRFVYVLNRAANTLSAVLLAEEEEGGHGHAHARFLAQQEEEEHLEFDEIEGSPYSLGLTLVDFIVSSDGAFAHILDNSGRLTTFSIDQVTGLITRTNELNTPVANPRTLKLSDDGQVLAVLGDTVFIAPLNDDGTLGTSATIAGTANWLDLVIRQGSGAASTAGGAVGFAWTPGAAVVPHGETALPGATRGQLGYLGEQIFVVNQADTSVTRLDQDATTGALTLSRTFDLPAQLTDPNLMLPIFDGEDLLIADSNSLVLFHPEATELEEEATTELPRIPASLFYVPESEFVLVGHATGTGSTSVLIEGEEMEVTDEIGPGGAGRDEFGYAETEGVLTTTTRL